MTKQTVDIIGTAERVSFPELELFDVPAKVDTGADSCAIWASNIVLSGTDELSFELFGPGSRFYSGKRIAARHYRRTHVKNSFGVTEFRYKVQLQVQIGERKIRVWFTLSERANMKYPVLLGRKFLKNKFIVDVTKKNVHVAKHAKVSQPRRVLVLGASVQKSGEFFADLAKRLDGEITFVVRSLSDLLFWIEPDRVSIRETITGQDIADFDLVYFKTHRKKYEFAIAAAEYLKFHHVYFFDEELANHVMYDKLSESVRLVLHGIPVPKTVVATTATLQTQADELVQHLGTPFVCKEINADRGRKNYLLQHAADLRGVLAEAESRDIFLLQQYVENEGYVRALVLSPEVPIVIRRSTVAHADPRKQHLNNPAGGKNATLLPASEVPSAVYDLATRAAKIMHRQIAGVDMIQDADTGAWSVLEVNTAPQLRTGAFAEEKRAALAHFIDFQLNR